MASTREHGCQPSVDLDKHKGKLRCNSSCRGHHECLRPEGLASSGSLRIPVSLFGLLSWSCLHSRNALSSLSLWKLPLWGVHTCLCVQFSFPGGFPLGMGFQPLREGGPPPHCGPCTGRWGQCPSSQCLCWAIITDGSLSIIP